MKTFIINPNDANQRLDKFIEKTVKKLPSSLLYKYIRLKRIKVNGKKAEINYRLKEGDIVEMYINDEFFEAASNPLAFLKIKPKLDIIYEDDNIMLINKEKGVIVHSDDKEDYNTLINHILAYLYNKGEYDPENENLFTPSLCNRIDRNTQGIVIAAKNADTLRIINEKIKNREIKKYYLCIAHGIFDKKSDTLKGYLIKNKEENKVYVTDRKIPNSKEIITSYKVLKEKGNLSLLEIELITGRTHQIRAHLAHIGHPLLGDGKYGTNELNKEYNIKTQELCAYKVEFKFKTIEEKLSYLNNKSFKIENIKFFQNF